MSKSKLRVLLSAKHISLIYLDSKLNKASAKLCTFLGHPVQDFTFASRSATDGAMLSTGTASYNARIPESQSVANERRSIPDNIRTL